MKLQTPSKAACTLGTAAFLLVGTTLLAQQLGNLGDAKQGKVPQAVVEMIEAQHILQKDVDDAVSAQLVDEFIKLLDPQKLYFLQADIADFKVYQHDLDDYLKSGNVEFALKVYEVFQARLKQRMDKVNQLIDEEHDFTVDESMTIDAKDLPYASSTAELDERWRKRIKYDLLSMKLEKKGDKKKGSKTQPEVDPNAPFDIAEARSRLHKRYKTLYDNYRGTEGEEVAEWYLTSLCTVFDPHTSYMSPRTLKEFDISMRLKLEGIGAALKVEDGYTIVNSIVPGGAAANDGRLKINDKIIGVANGTADFVDTVEMKLTKVVDMIRGKAGTTVRLKVQTADTGEVKVYDIKRAQVELKQQEVKGEIIDAATRIPGARGKIGVIRIPSFYRDFQGADNNDANFASTARDVSRELARFKAAGGVDAILIDLRFNGGGALTEAIDVSGLFVNAGPVVQVKTQSGKPKVLSYDENNGDVKTPLVVVTNRLSASASEIFAGVIKDYGRGLVVGDSRTHGKGTVQSVMPVGPKVLPIFNKPQLGAVKLTIQQFYRVNGQSTQKLGVPSDITLPSLLDHMDLGEEFLDNAMPFDKIEAARHSMYNLTAKDLVTSLADASKKRVEADADFQRINSDIEKYLSRKQRKSISLNEQELRKERVEEEQKTREKAESGDESGDEPVFADNAYNKELLSITLDYLQGLSEKKTARR
ncbi:MAG TPA: tail-specific protease [Planctomycetaceae bacterium]|jgi:carboxyl-terminal processing protease|nr:tail-specific protease [Planctomycetaceae bacterium]